MTQPSAIAIRQSPIDITAWVESDGVVPDFVYAGAATRVERLHDLPMIMFDRGSELHLASDRYRLLQVHWHTPAEHTINGEDFAAELHLVHVKDERDLLVVGTAYRIGQANETIQRLIEETLAAGAEDGTAPRLSAGECVPNGEGFYHYVGSLTAPPFSEPVLWYVSRTIRTVSQRQVEQLQALTGGPNARPLQDRNNRTILCVGCGA